MTPEAERRETLCVLSGKHDVRLMVITLDHANKIVLLDDACRFCDWRLKSSDSER